MTLKNIFMLGGVLAGAAYLRDKGRRDRVVGQARGLLDKAKTRATELASQIQHRGSEATSASGFDNGTSANSSYSSVGGSSIGGDSGYGTRTYR